MKTILFFIILILLIQFCLSVTANTKALEEISSRVKFYDLIKRKMKNIVYQVASRAIRSPNYNVIKSIRSKLRSLSIWMAGEEKQATFIGRCLGAAKRLKVVMPIILVKLGVIITMLAFLTLFSLKTLGLVIFLSFLGTSGITKIGAVPGSRQHDTTTHQSHPQNVHLHIQPNKDNRHSSLLGESYLIDRDTDSLLSDKLAWYQQYINSNNYLNTDISA